MKPANVIMGASLWLISFASCDGTSKKTEPVNVDTANVDTANNTIRQGPCSGYGNVYVPTDIADEMSKLFLSEYVQKLENKERKFKSSDLLDRNLIEGFDRALKDVSNDYDGVRIYMGAPDNIQSESMFLLVPTKPGNDHPNVWGNKITVSNSTFKNFNIAATDAKTLVESYRSKFKEQSDLNDYSTAVNKGLSSGVWINECVFEIMNDFLAANPTFQGFRIHAAAYPLNTQTKPGGFEYDQQSTVLFVPVDQNGQDDWTILKPAKAVPKADVWNNALNHGELCPKNCPPTEF